MASMRCVSLAERGRAKWPPRRVQVRLAAGQSAVMFTNSKHRPTVPENEKSLGLECSYRTSRSTSSCPHSCKMLVCTVACAVCWPACQEKKLCKSNETYQSDLTACVHTQPTKSHPHAVMLLSHPRHHNAAGQVHWTGAFYGCQSLTVEIILDKVIIKVNVIFIIRIWGTRQRARRVTTGSQIGDFMQIRLGSKTVRNRNCGRCRIWAKWKYNGWAGNIMKVRVGTGQGTKIK